jgi:shikimate dehydrogenase
MTHIDGKTRLAGVIGWPLEHTLSPAMHNAAYEALGLNWVYIPLPLREGAELLRLASIVKSLPVVGFNVTMPYKRVMLNMCDEVAAMAQLAGAVNAVHVVDGRLIGYNTDGRGLVESLASEAGFQPEGRNVVLLGAGGAAGAAVVGLILGKAARITVAARRDEMSEALVDRLQGRTRDTSVDTCGMGDELRGVIEDADLIVNATPVGMGAGDVSLVPTDWMHEGQVVADMIYRPTETALLRAATEAGATPVGGLGMLVAQGAIAIEIWSTGATITAPRDIMRAAAEAELASMPRVGQGE